MTATLFALHADEGRISFSTTLEQALPALASRMDPAYRNVTMEMLLAHRGGLPRDPSRKTLLRLWCRAVSARVRRSDDDSRAARVVAVRGALQQQPELPPGTKFSYSNIGYMVLGAVLEQLTDTPWETLIRERVFGPLGMKSGGFGSPVTSKHVDAPWPHLAHKGKLAPVPSWVDNPPAFGPAGSVHCTLADWGKFVAMHLAGARGQSRFLSAASFAKLHTPNGDDYAGGWIVTTRPWASGVVLTHSGSNGMWFATVCLAPKLDRAFLVVTNRGDETAAQAIEETLDKLVRMSFAWI